MAITMKRNPTLGINLLRDRFSQTGRIQIADFLIPESAIALEQELVHSNDWRHVIRGGENVFEIPATELDAMSEAARRPVDDAVFRAAADGFQFRYDVLRVPDRRAGSADIPPSLAALTSMLNRPELLAMIRKITGDAGIVFADAQATRYRAGDFLTRHDDHAADKNRRFAYVLSLSPAWQPDWGGLLIFHEPDGSVPHLIVPRFNALSLFAVPQPHSVTYVTPFARAPRLSVTGWFRADGPA
jgi:hypothetical protein